MSIKVLWSELRVTFGLTALLPLPALAGFAMLEWFTWRDGRYTVAEMLSAARRDFVLLLPLAAAMAAAHLMSVEREEGFAELRDTYPAPPYQLALLRTSIALLFTLVALAGGWIAYGLAIPTLDPSRVILPALAPTILMLGLALLVNNLSGSYWASSGAVMTYWFVEVRTRGELTRALFLFNPAWPLPGLDSTLNQYLLASLGLLFLAANVGVSQRRSLAVITPWNPHSGFSVFAKWHIPDGCAI